jgi:hypothetical protein
MPGLQWSTFWEGNRAELFATYILSSVAAVVPVPRPVDYGLDLLCTLTHRDEYALYAGSAFGVQVKSVNTAEVKYGGLDKRGNWKQHEVEWLYGQDQPILLCLVDLKEWQLRVYSTVRMWWVRWMKGPPGEIVLIPDFRLEDFKEQTRENRYPHVLLEDVDPKKSYGDGYLYRVPLGKPIIEVFLKEQEAQDYRDRLRECLDRWVELDYMNVTYRRLKVPFTVEWSEWETNVPPKSSAKVWQYWNPTLDKNIPEVLSSIAPAVSSLLLNLRAQGQLDKLELVLPIAHLVRQYGLLDPMGGEVLEEFSAA